MDQSIQESRWKGNDHRKAFPFRCWLCGTHWNEGFHYRIRETTQHSGSIRQGTSSDDNQGHEAYSGDQTKTRTRFLEAPYVCCSRKAQGCQTSCEGETLRARDCERRCNRCILCGRGRHGAPTGRGLGRPTRDGPANQIPLKGTESNQREDLDKKSKETTPFCTHSRGGTEYGDGDVKESSTAFISSSIYIILIPACLYAHAGTFISVYHILIDPTRTKRAARQLCREGSL